MSLAIGDFEKDRNFICSCGRSYLSYAALFTHIKQKHGGKAPGPIVRPCSERKRGRPRKNPSTGPLKDSEQEHHNGISSLDNIHNISEREQIARRAERQLGCGGFVAFEAYMPEYSYRSPHYRKDGHKGKPFRPSIVSAPADETGGSRLCNSIMELKDKSQMFSRPSFSFYSDRENCQPPFRHLNKREQSEINVDRQTHAVLAAGSSELLRIYEGRNPQDIAMNNPNPELNQLLSISTQTSYLMDELLYSSKISIDEGLELFWLQSSKRYPEQSRQQLTLFVNLYRKFLMQFFDGDQQVLKQKNLSDLLDATLTLTFLEHYLPKRVKELELCNLPLFQGEGPMTMLLQLQSWISVFVEQCRRKEKAQGRLVDKAVMETCRKPVQVSIHVLTKKTSTQKNTDENQKFIAQSES